MLTTTILILGNLGLIFIGYYLVRRHRARRSIVILLGSILSLLLAIAARYDLVPLLYPKFTLGFMVVAMWWDMWKAYGDPVSKKFIVLAAISLVVGAVGAFVVRPNYSLPPGEWPISYYAYAAALVGLLIAITNKRVRSNYGTLSACHEHQG